MNVDSSYEYLSTSRKKSPRLPQSPPAMDDRIVLKRDRSDSRSRIRDYNKNRRRSDRRTRSHSPRKYKSKHSRSRSRSYSPTSRRRAPQRRSSYSRSPDRRRPEHPEKSRCLGVFGLSVYTTQSQILAIFSKYGSIERAQVVTDAKTGRSRGFCFVYFDHTEDAVTAKEQCSGMEIDARRIRVDYSITQRAHTPTPGVYMGRPTRRDDDDYNGYDDKRSRDRRSPPSPAYHRDRESSSRRRRRSRSRSYSPRDRRHR